MRISRLSALLAVAVICAASSGLTAQSRGAGAQGRGMGVQGRTGIVRPGAGGGRGQVEREGLTPRQVQAEFDRYAIDQAQDALQLSDEQYPPFVRRMTELQQVRRRTRMQRTQLLVELTRLMRTRPSVDDARLAAATKAVDDQERNTLAEVQRAYAAIDEILTPRQRARFRVLEDQLEQRLMDLLSRARQGPRR